MFVNQTVAQGIKACGEFIVVTEINAPVVRLIKRLEEAHVIGSRFGKPARQVMLALVLNALVEQFQVLLGRGYKGFGIGLVVQHQDQLIPQGLTQLEAQIEGDEVIAD